MLDLGQQLPLTTPGQQPPLAVPVLGFGTAGLGERTKAATLDALRAGYRPWGGAGHCTPVL